MYSRLAVSQPSTASSTLCYSARLMKPFIAVLAGDPRIPEAALAFCRDLDPDERVPAATAHTLLQAAEGLLGDSSLGLRASLCIEPGDLGVLHYALGTASDLEASLRIQTRYSRLLGDVLLAELTVQGARAELRLASRVVLPRSVAEYGLASFLSHRHSVWPEPVLRELQVFLPFAAPVDSALYSTVLGPHVHFEAPFLGFSLASEALSMPVRTPDPKLHEVLRRQVERAQSALPAMQSVTETVRRLLVTELSTGNPNAERVARLMHVSASTLSRRLASEGTTFSAVLDELRMRLSLDYVASTSMTLTEVVLLTGFSHAAAFHRAFKRWTGRTPAQYRREYERLGTSMLTAGRAPDTDPAEAD